MTYSGVIVSAAAQREGSREQKRGYVLLEFLLYVAIVGAVLTVAVGVGLDLLRSRMKASSLEFVNQNARLSLERMTSAIRAADGVNTSGSVFGTSPGRLSLQMPVAGQNPTVFDVAGGILQVTEGVGSPVPLTATDVSVTGLTFAHLVQGASQGVRIVLTLRRVNPGGVAELSVERTYVGAALIR